MQHIQRVIRCKGSPHRFIAWVNGRALVLETSKKGSKFGLANIMRAFFGYFVPTEDLSSPLLIGDCKEHAPPIRLVPLDSLLEYRSPFLPALEAEKASVIFLNDYRLSKVVAASVLTAFSSSLILDYAVALPTGEQSISGNVKFNTVGDVMNITATANKSIARYNTFNIAQHETVNFNLPSRTSQILNFIGDQNPSQILGKLNSNGIVYLVNPNGMFFGQNAQVNVAGLVGSTLNINPYKFISGNLVFEKNQTTLGKIENNGIINLKDNGLGLFLGNQIENNGTITGNNAQIGLFSGNKITVGLNAGNSITADVTINTGLDTSVTSAINNTETISSVGGEIQLQAKQQQNIYNQLVNNTGIIEAKGITTNNGVIEILADNGTVNSSGTLDVSNASGKGGTVHVLGDAVSLTGNALVDASGQTGGGEILIGGDLQGENPNIKNADYTYVSHGSKLKADAYETGNGGKIITWADDSTWYYGDISAKGGSLSGNGGFAEVSGKENLIFKGSANLSSLSGLQGTLLLDPLNIIVSSSGTAIYSDVDQFSDQPGTTQTISPATLDAIAGNVVLQATNSITVNSAINLTTAGASLTLQGNNAININAAITTSNGDLNLTGGSISIAAPINVGTANITQVLNGGVYLYYNLLSGGSLTGNNISITNNATHPYNGITLNSGSSINATTSVTLNSTNISTGDYGTANGPGIWFKSGASITAPILNTTTVGNIIRYDGATLNIASPSLLFESTGGGIINLNSAINRDNLTLKSLTGLVNINAAWTGLNPLIQTSTININSGGSVTSNNSSINWSGTTFNIAGLINSGIGNITQTLNGGAYVYYNLLSGGSLTGNNISITNNATHPYNGITLNSSSSINAANSVSLTTTNAATGDPYGTVNQPGIWLKSGANITSPILNVTTVGNPIRYDGATLNIASPTLLFESTGGGTINYNSPLNRNDVTLKSLTGAVNINALINDYFPSILTNTITVNNPITLTTSGASLTLQGNNAININAAITTSNGDLNLTGGSISIAAPINVGTANITQVLNGGAYLYYNLLSGGSLTGNNISITNNATHPYNGITLNSGSNINGTNSVSLATTNTSTVDYGTVNQPGIWLKSGASITTPTLNVTSVGNPIRYDGATLNVSSGTLFQSTGGGLVNISQAISQAGNFSLSTSGQATLTGGSITSDGNISLSAPITTSGNALTLNADWDKNNSGNIAINNNLTALSSLLTLHGAQIDINNTVDVGATGTVNILPTTAKAINIGSSIADNDSSTLLDISRSELVQIRAGTLNIGSGSLTSDINLAGNLDLSGRSGTDGGAFNLGLNTAGNFNANGYQMHLGRDAIWFDGVNDYVLIPGNTSLNFTTQFSTSMWFNADSLASWAELASQNPTTGYGWELTYHDSGSSGAWVGNGSWAGALAAAPSIGNWHHMVGTWDGTTIKLYINGSLVSSTAKTGSMGLSGTNVIIGAAERYIGTAQFHGEIDGTSLYNRALSSTEVSTLYNNGLGNNLLASSGQVGNWNFSEGSGITTSDISGSNNTGTLTNGASWTNSKNLNINANYITTGKILGESSDINITANSVITVGGGLSTNSNGIINLQSNNGINVNDSIQTNAGNISINADLDNNNIGNINTLANITSATGQISLVAGGNITLHNPTSITSGAAGNSIVLASKQGSVINNVGSAVLNTPNGRWIVYSDDPNNTIENGLTYTKRYNRSYTSHSPSGITETGNVINYSIAPIITITADNNTREYGDTNPALTASYTGFIDGDTVSHLTGTPSLTTAAINTSNVGTYVITAGLGTLVSDLGYQFSAPVNGTLSVTKATLTATADNKIREYGDTNPALSITYTGFKNSETSSVIDTLASGSTPATNTSNVGSYTITGSGAVDNNYNFNYVDGTLDVTKATLNVVAHDKTRAYQDPNPTFTGTYSGFKNGENSSVIDTLASYNTNASTNSLAGKYAITASSALDNNYTFNYINGELTIEGLSQPDIIPFISNPVQNFGVTRVNNDVIYSSEKTEEQSDPNELYIPEIDTSAVDSNRSIEGHIDFSELNLSSK